MIGITCGGTGGGGLGIRTKLGPDVVSGGGVSGITDGGTGDGGGGKDGKEESADVGWDLITEASAKSAMQMTRYEHAVIVGASRAGRAAAGLRSGSCVRQQSASSQCSVTVQYCRRPWK